MDKRFHFLLICLCLFLEACSSKVIYRPGSKLATVDRQDEAKVDSENDLDDRENRYLSQLSKEERDNFKRHGPTRDFRPDKFLDVTDELGLKDLAAQRLMAVDFDSDGFTDLVLLEEVYSTPKFMRYLPNKKKFVALEYDPFQGNAPRASFITFVDLDKDKVPDIIVGVLNQKSELNTFPIRVYKGRKKIGRVFYKEIKDAFPGMQPGPFSTIALLDYNLDGYLDIFVGAWFEKHDGVDLPRADQFWVGTEKLKFINRSDLLKDQKIQQRTRNNFVSLPTFGASTCDLDQNGYPDILTSSTSGEPNVLWMNVEKEDLSEDKSESRHFVDYAASSGFDQDSEGKLLQSGGGNSQYSLCVDYNNDGVFDIIQGEVAHYYDPETRDRSAILTGALGTFPPKFVRTEYHSVYQMERWNQGDRRAVAFDHNVDGLTDILVDNSGFPPFSRLILFEQETNHAYSDIAENAGINILNPSGTIVMDFNQDGMPDLITGQVNVRASEIKPRLWAFKNIQGRKGRRSITFHLQGQQGNSGGWGSLVILKTEKKMMRQWYQPSYGNLPGQNESVVHYGLGSDQLLEVEVRWPFLEVDRLGRRIPKIKKYDLSNFLFQDHVEVTLCENGRYKRGRFKCD